MNRPIESAADLHRELCKRGLELRPDVGRDAALVGELADKLGVAPARFISGLKSSGKSAEEYMRALMLVAEPFARMFREIWNYLGKHCAPKADESLVIRFGFDGDNKEIDWNQFRVMAESVRSIRGFGPALLWPSAALFHLSRLLVPHLPTRRHPRYRLGEPFELAAIKVVNASDQIGHRARAVIQSLIDEIHAEWPVDDSQGTPHDAWVETGSPPQRHLPELSATKNETPLQPRERKRSIRDMAFLLTDLIPSWGDICEQWENIPHSDKEEAERYFREQVEPLLASTEAPSWIRTQEALDLLDLPFWRYRWHTYEVWASVKGLEALDEFRPQLVIKDGHLALDAASPALVAILSGGQKIYAHVQGETKLPQPLGKRQAIKPDLRFSLDDPSTNSGTVAIVEFKQRRDLDPQHALEVLNAYSLGVGRGGGVVLVNYDEIPNITAPPLCTLIGNVHPGRADNVRAYQDAVRNCFALAQIFPLSNKRFVLLDISSSMSAEYVGALAQRNLRQLAALFWIKIFRFNNGLVAGGDLKTDHAIVTNGGTQLGAALEQLFSLPEAGIPERLVIVTDGEHDQPRELLAKVGEYRECRPDQLDALLNWLTEP